MELSGLLFVIRKTAGKLLLAARLALALVLLKGRVIAVEIDAVAPFLRHFGRDFHGEPVRIVQMEGLLARDHRFGHVRVILRRHKRIFALQPADTFFKFLQTLLKSFGEFRLLLFEFLRNPRAVGLQLGIYRLILFDKGGGDLRKTSLGQIDFAAVTHRAADNAAQNIALIGVGRGNALFVADHKGGRAHMVENDAERPRRLLVRPVRPPRKLRDLFDCVGENIRFIDAGFSVEHAQRALQPHARIHVFLLQLDIAAVRPFIETHKDVVPNFEESAAVTVGIAARPAFGLSDDKHLGIGAAGPREARGPPPIVFAGHKIDIFLFDARLFPKPRGLVVAGQRIVTAEHRHGQPVGGDTEIFLARQKLVAPGDHFLFEIISQRPVAQHFEKGAVALVAHVVDIARADAFLHVGETVARRVLFPQKIGHQRVHARRRKQNSGVVFGNEGRRRDHLMAAVPEKAEIHFS